MPSPAGIYEYFVKQKGADDESYDQTLNERYFCVQIS